MIEFVDEERIPLINDDEDPQYEEETSFGGVPKSFGVDIQCEATRGNLHQMERNIEKIDKEINALERNLNVKIPDEERKSFRYSGKICKLKSLPENTSVSQSRTENFTLPVRCELV